MNLAIKDVRYNGFQQYCSLINETSINFFRNNNYFKSIVENVNFNYGQQYYNLILKNYSEYLDKISWDNIEKLSNIGLPKNNLQYTFNNKKIQVTPTILRYILFTFNILNHIKNKTDIKQLNIVEIGGGFAFQAVLLYKFSHLFDLEVLNYTVIDLEEVSNLQNLFIEKCNEIDNNSFKNFKSIAYENFTNKKTYNFAISNYALGELNTYWQNTYINNIISKIDHGYFCWNFSPANPDIHSYFTSKDIIKEEENPQTNCPPVKSYILRY
tara:strand:+ start:5907 stop:6713 length:807 start_codon:yes stop_codon:yes gene_type:complete